MSESAPTGIFNGPTSLVMTVPVNSARKGISQQVAASGGFTYMASVWVRADRDVDWYCEVIPAVGDPISTAVPVTANTWTLATTQWSPSTSMLGTIRFTTVDLGRYEMSCAQFCRVERGYDPFVDILPNGWSRGGLRDTRDAKVHIERYSASTGEWTEVLAEEVAELGLKSYGLLTSDSGALTFTTSDLYAPLDTELYYRARIDNDTAGTSSPDSGSAPVDALTDSRWLLIPSLRGRTGQAKSGDVLQVHVANESFESSSDSNAGVFWPVGRSNAVVVTDSAVSGEQGTLELSFRDPAAYETFDAIRAARCPVLLRGGHVGIDMWIRFVGSRKRRFILGSGNIRPTVTVDWVEVDPPKNAV